LHNHKHKRFVNVQEKFLNPLLEIELNRKKRADSNTDIKLNENKETLDNKQQQQQVIPNRTESNENAHSAIGVTLVLGFIFMLIVDQIGGKISHRPHMS
jgi:hypothetical protein